MNDAALTGCPEVLFQDQSYVSLLPEDLINGILSRLPVKTLMRFRAVCNKWKKIINSSYFKRQHFVQESNRTNLLVCWKGIMDIPKNHDPNDDESIYVNSISLFPYERLGSLEAVVELGKGLFKDAIFGVWGPCHGILCVRFSDGIALWNPATRNLWPIPKCPLVDMMSVALCSFWIDPLTNAFKVFCVSQCWPKPSFVMYTSGNNSWKRLEAPLTLGDHVSNRQCFRYTVSNGHYYFYKFRGVKSHTVCTIIAYDIFKDMFQEIHIPKFGVSCDRELVLDLFGDSLALFAVETINDVPRTEIWVMKEKGCWTKVFNGDIPVSTPGAHRTLGFWNQNEIFIYCNSYDVPHICVLMIYDLVSGKTRKILVESRECRGGVFWADFFPLSYKESLISIGINGR